MSDIVAGSRILILGGNPETGALVEVANGMGLKTVVVDPYPNSPAKLSAHIAYDVNVADLDRVDEIIRNEKIDGILVGVADPLVPYYYELCNRHSFPCYATNEIIGALFSKANFAKTCVEYGIDITPNYETSSGFFINPDLLKFPVVVKPVDGGAGVGISICHNVSDFRVGLEKALGVSLQKKVILEKYMDCDDMFAYYTFVDGVAYLSALADRYKTKKQNGGSPVCIAAEYPSKYLDRFLVEVHQKLLRMFANLNIKNGVLLIQFFVDDDSFYAYDPGFRLQGESPHIYLKHFNNFDHREMLLNFALTGSMHSGEFSALNDYSFRNKYAVTVWILLRAGTIGVIDGVDSIRSHPGIIYILQRFNVGSVVTDAMLGTERQVFARIFTVSNSKYESAENIDYIFKHLSIMDVEGNNMILDTYSLKDL